nr:hypothetical protein [Phytoactinopolyspora limicola]
MLSQSRRTGRDGFVGSIPDQGGDPVPGWVFHRPLECAGIKIDGYHVMLVRGQPFDHCPAHTPATTGNDVGRHRCTAGPGI